MTTDPLPERLPRPPTAELFGQRVLGFDKEKGTIRLSFVATDAFLNPAGAVQGGILVAMLDDTMGPALWVMNGEETYSVTIDLSVSFLAAAKPGLLYGEGRVVQRGKTIAFLEAQLSDPDGRIVARSTASARVVKA
ncbi:MULTISPECIES: PaaI family thioesterase [Variovorax]|uniref:PaaI family thioesterase n=1 Tax=Variovorax TaxID=34072 RepID=UPI0021ACDED9|nr:PaaI family thioesterase [Variovorax paradoxus]UVH60408.1 PaaI family thioesterase [Variovorax paradoxus]